MTPFVFAPRPALTMGVATRCTARPGAARVCFERWAERVAGHAWREEPLGVGLRGIASALGRGRALGLLVSRVLGLLVSLVLDLVCWCLQNSDPELSAIYCGSWQFGRVSQSFFCRSCQFGGLLQGVLAW